MFDQPDIRAKWVFKAIHPKEWTVVSNVFENKKAHNKEELTKRLSGIATNFGVAGIFKGIEAPTTITFNESPAIASYLFAIVAGPYGYAESNVEGMPPMRIYARQSLMADVAADTANEMFKVTQAGIKYYQNLFGKKYSFPKYDQIFVPEFQSGAMENVGCVTFKEDYLARGQQKTLNKRMTLGITALHELAHHWFGNLVTMKWWDDLWLNESFATYVSYLAMDNSSELKYFKGEWSDFMDRKYAGINDDQKNTTHPIFAEIKAADDAQSVFDGISYGKGASFLK